MNLMKYRWLFILIFLTTMAASLVAWAVFGLNQGIDFTGGTVIRYPLTAAEYKSVSSDSVKNLLTTGRLASLRLKPGPPQPYSQRNVSLGRDEYGIIIKTRALKGWAEQRAILEVLNEHFGKAVEKTGLQIAMVDPAIGRETVRNAFLAVLIASILVMIYIAFRFEFKSGVAGVVALLHDFLFVLGVFAVLHKEISSSIIAAILTIIGYSINDTIVVFDRIRENMRNRRKGQSFDELVNESILQTMQRSLNTSATTVLAILVLYVVGGESIKEFCLALILGVTAGTYSSIFVASPLWAIWKNWEERRHARGAKPALATAK
ncbi:MAG: protein translocase subunit SecF [Patescibacteria group bacterium]